MAGITLAQAEAKLATWLAADDAVATNQSYTINGRSLNRTNAAEIRQNITYWQDQIERLERKAGTRRTTRYGVL